MIKACLWFPRSGEGFAEKGKALIRQIAIENS
jgi:hypothetical protein